MPENQQNTLKRMETMLRHCRRRIKMAEVAVHLRQGLDFYLKGLLGIVGLFLALRVLAYIIGAPTTINWVHVLCVAVVFGLVTFGFVLLRSLRGNPVHTTGAAERLDLSQSTHNRIATAIALLRSGDDSLFAEAAIRDGFEHLEELQALQPYVETSVTSWRRKGTRLALILVLVLAGQFLEAEARISGGEPTTPGSTAVASLDNEPTPVTSESMVEPTPRVANRDERQPAGDTPTREDDSGESDTGQRAEPDKETRSEGPAGQHASGKSRSSQSSSNSRSPASGAGVKSEPGKTESSKHKKPRDKKKQPASQPKVDQKNQKGGSINARGSSGSSSMRTTQNEWSSEVKAKSSDSDDCEQEEEPDEEMDKDKQRLGVQPALKSRTSRLSRELSLAMGNGVNNDMMKGRGGPSAQKKARGTATMIMGVPVPGFVRGRLLPGPTKSTQEEVEPSPREDNYAVASELQQASPEESPQERFRPSAAMNAQTRDYLIRFHAEKNENKRHGVTTNE